MALKPRPLRKALYYDVDGQPTQRTMETGTLTQKLATLQDTTGKRQAKEPVFTK
ncbi:MAG UNVERIFIED_CONTAM: hypothetical protein LVR29_03865 [Microcystis novacekii LVE1205-3]